MTRGTDFNQDIFAESRLGFYHITTTACRFNGSVFWMDIGLHVVSCLVDIATPNTVIDAPHLLFDGF